MQRRATFFPIFFIFLLLAFLIFFFARTGAFAGFTGFIEQMTVPVQRFTFGIFHQNNQSTEDKLREENSRLLTALAKQKELEIENRALHDQFEATNPSPKKLLPTKVIGMNDEQIIIDKGIKEGIHVGNVIVYKDNVIGKVVTSSAHLSVVALLIHQQTAFTAQTSKTETLGVIKGKGNNTLFFENVVLSDTLERDDLVRTRGDVDAKGQGFPPDLIVGKIVSINKKASALFQTAEVKSLVDFSRLHTVFVLMNQ